MNAKRSDRPDIPAELRWLVYLERLERMGFTAVPDPAEPACWRYRGRNHEVRVWFPGRIAITRLDSQQTIRGGKNGS